MARREPVSGRAGDRSPPPGAWARAAAALLVAAAALAAFWPVLDNGFIEAFDDRQYVLDNPHVRAGLTADGVAWALTSTHASNWHPLTWLSHMLDVEAYGLDPRGHHRTSLFLHAANAALLVLALSRLTGSLGRSAFAAALFALHPLRVESVAWVAERKDVLSAFFAMLALLAYARWVERPSTPRFAAVFAAVALGLTAKPMLVSVPLVFLLLDYWPLARWGGADASDAVRAAPRLIAEKLPLLALSVVSSALTLEAARAGGALVGLDARSVGERLANASNSIAGYLGMTAVPFGLAPFYPHPGGALPEWRIAASAALVVAVTALVLLRAGKRGYLVTGWLWFLVTLLPVLGIVQVGRQAMADRYTYLPSIGLFLMVAWGLPDLARAAFPRVVEGRLRVAGLAGGAALVVAAALLTRVQIGFWRDDVTLFGHAAEVAPSALAHTNLGVHLAEHGKTDEAIRHFEAALGIDARDPDALYNLGVQQAARGRYEEAARRFREAAEIRPGFAKARLNLGVALRRLGRLDEAERELAAAARLDPSDARAPNDLGNVLAAAGRPDEAIAAYEKALALDPGLVEARFNRATLLLRQGRASEAAAGYREAVRLKPDSPKYRRALAAALSAAGDTEGALREIEAAKRVEEAEPRPEPPPGNGVQTAESPFR